MEVTVWSRKAAADHEDVRRERTAERVRPLVASSSSAAAKSSASVWANQTLAADVSGRRRAVAESLVRTRCYSDGKIAKAFGELRTAKGAQEDEHCARVADVPFPVSRVCSTWMLRREGDPTSPAFVTTSSDNKTTSPRQSADSCVLLRSPAPNKRICSHQQSLIPSTTSATSPCTSSLVQARKRSLGVSGAAHFAKSTDKRTSVPIAMSVESQRNAVDGTLRLPPSLFSTPAIDELLPQGDVHAQKRTCSFQQRRSRNPGNLSLDLSQVVQTGSGPSTSATMTWTRLNDQVALCSKVTDFLYIGGAVAAKNKSLLLQNGITHVINCAAGVAPASFPEEFCYYNIRLRDHSSQDIARHFYSMFDFIERARACGGRIFLHCVKGISRSPTMAIAYLMWHKRISMYEALDFVRQARSIVDPNAGFIFQLTEWEQLHPDGRLKFQGTIAFRVDVAHAVNSDPTGKCHSTVVGSNPLFVPLMDIDERHFRDPTKDFGEQCLIVACADYMFVWCGTDVSEDHVDVAESGAIILQRYEAFPLKCERVRQGQEPAAFWHLVGDGV